MQAGQVLTGAGVPKTVGRAGEQRFAAENAARYAPFVRGLEAIDTARLGALYSRFYPLFQQAYVELGYPGKYFNDRLVEVIDHLLEAPELREPPALTVRHVLLEYADPELESRSAGQKLMMRMGRDNEARVKAKLKEIRARVAASAG